MLKKDLRQSRQFKEALTRSEQARRDGRLTPYAYTNNVPLTWCVRFDITPLMLLTWCYIRDCTKNMKEGAYTGSIKGLCAKFNGSLPTQRHALEVLEEKGFIRKEISPRTGVGSWVRYVDALKDYNAISDRRSIEEVLEYNITLRKIRAGKNM